MMIIKSCLVIFCCSQILQMRDYMEASFQHEDEIESLVVSEVKKRAKKGFIAILVFSLLIAALCLYRFYSTAQLIEDGLFYKNELMSTEMLPFWKELGEQEQSQNKTKLIEQGQHQITRQELGHMGWTILHMMTGSFPEELTPELVKKWNAFLVLFGQFYPCKVCSTHFLKMIKQVGPFNGTKKQQLMVYLCDMHNIVNKRLNKPIHSCENIKKQWNTCGCSGQL